MAAGYQTHVDELQRDLETRTQWAQAIDAQLKTRTDELAAQVAELGRCVALLDQAEATVVERTNWALRLQSELEQAQARLALAQSSRWIKLGRMLNVGPELNR